MKRLFLTWSMSIAGAAAIPAVAGSGRTSACSFAAGSLGPGRFNRRRTLSPIGMTLPPCELCAMNHEFQAPSDPSRIRGLLQAQKDPTTCLTLAVLFIETTNEGRTMRASSSRLRKPTIVRLLMLFGFALAIGSLFAGI